MARKIIVRFCKKAGSKVVQFAQGVPAYRHLVKKFAPSVTFREATNEDMRAVYRWQNPENAWMREIRHNPHVTNWVAKHKDRVIGFVQLVYHPHERFPYAGYWLSSLHVSVSRRGLGIGEQLSEKAIQTAKMKGASVLRLLVDEDNRPAIRLYEKLCFSRVSIPELEVHLKAGTTQKGRRRILMQKKLDDSKYNRE